MGRFAQSQWPEGKLNSKDVSFVSLDVFEIGNPTSFAAMLAFPFAGVTTFSQE